MTSLILRWRRACILWRLRCLERRINPNHFDPALSRKIDRCVLLLETQRPADEELT